MLDFLTNALFKFEIKIQKNLLNSSLAFRYKKANLEKTSKHEHYRQGLSFY
jgi:hypothetical protein